MLIRQKATPNKLPCIRVPIPIKCDLAKILSMTYDLAEKISMKYELAKKLSMKYDLAQKL